MKIHIIKRKINKLNIYKQINKYNQKKKQKQMIMKIHIILKKTKQLFMYKQINKFNNNKIN